MEGKGPDRDCDFRTEHDWMRNQLERNIESLLAFQANGRFPESLYFTLLTPRLFQRHPRSRLYGYRMTEYLRDPSLIVPDIERCSIARRDEGNREYPLLRERMKVLKLVWVSYEGILERAFGQAPLNVLQPERIVGLAERLQTIASASAVQGALSVDPAMPPAEG